MNKDIDFVDKILSDDAEKEKASRKPLDLDQGMKSLVLGVVKYFGIIITIIGVAVCILLLITEELGINFFNRSFILLSIVSLIFSMIIFFTYIKQGQEKGRQEQDYKDKLKEYHGLVDNKDKKGLDDFLVFARKQERELIITELTDELGVDEETLRQLPRKEIRTFKRKSKYTRSQRSRIRKLQKNSFKSRLPKNAAQIMAVETHNPSGAYGVNLNAESNYLISRIIPKFLSSVLFIGLGVGIVFTVGVGNVQEIVFKIFMIAGTFAWSIYGGYMTGLTASSVKRKGTLIGVSWLLRDMERWQREQQKTE